MPLLIGSAALNIYDETRQVKDIDVVAYKHQIPSLFDYYGGIGSVIFRKETAAFKTIDGLHVEVHLANKNKAWEVLFKELDVDDTSYIVEASLDVLYSIKLSHINFPKNFDKHIEDFVWLGNKVGWVDKYPKFTKLNRKAAQKRYDARVSRTPSLNKSVDEFFGQSQGKVKSWFVHDDIHKVMAHKDEPIFLAMQEDKSSAWCGFTLWQKLSFEDKCKCVLEEAYVIALERKIIPFIMGDGAFYTSWEALKWSMMRICTNLTSGWFREFATMNYFEIMAYADTYYDLKFFSAFEKGGIKLLDNASS